MQCAHGYSGCIGVVPSGAHDSSRGVAGLPLRSALRIAVIGRQKLYAYFASNIAMNASHSPSRRARRAARNRRGRSSWRAAICRTIGLKVRGPVKNQKRPMLVCSALRFVLLRPPSLADLVEVLRSTPPMSRAGGGRRTELRAACHHEGRDAPDGRFDRDGGRHVDASLGVGGGSFRPRCCRHSRATPGSSAAAFLPSSMPLALRVSLRHGGKRGREIRHRDWPSGRDGSRPERRERRRRGGRLLRGGADRRSAVSL